MVSLWSCLPLSEYQWIKDFAISHLEEILNSFSIMTDRPTNQPAKDEHEGGVIGKLRLQL